MNEKRYEVTIGIPVYNVEENIKLTMDSALAQTFSSIEFLICDDCGTDSSINIVKEYQDKHLRGGDIRIIRQPHNMGIGAARNRMIDEARGKYFYSLDADDVISENAIELLYGTAQKYEAEIVFGSYERVYQNNGKTVKKVPYVYPHHVFLKPDKYAKYVYDVGIQGMNWNYLIDIDIIRKNNLRVTPVGHGYGEDFTFTVDLPTYITRAVLLSDITYSYYIRGIDKHKRKKMLSRKNMDMAINALEEKKRRIELRNKCYYSQRISRLLMYEFSFACEMLIRRSAFDVPYTDEEIRGVLWHPMSFMEIMKAKAGRRRNITYYLISKMPTPIFAVLLRLFSKMYSEM